MNEFALTYSPVIIVTLCYILLYYVFMMNVLRVKMKVIRQCKEKGEHFERYTVHYPELLAADRIQLNMLEHMPPFLILLWLQARVVSPDSAALLGWIYLVLRVLYPFLLGTEIKRSFRLRVLLTTFPAYGVMVVMGFWILMNLP